MLPDSGNCPQIKGIFVVFRDQDCLVRDFFFFFFFFFFFNSEHAQMGHVWSGHVHSVYNLVHVPDSCVRMHGSSFSSSDD